jgi:hypothetical protein
LEEVELMEVPKILLDYLEEVKTAMHNDLFMHRDRADQLKRVDPKRFSSEQSLKNAVFYVLNSMWERKDLETATNDLHQRGLANVLATEYDGIFIMRHKDHTWEEIEAVLGENFCYKPYRAISDLLAHFGVSIPAVESINGPTDGPTDPPAQDGAPAKRPRIEDKAHGIFIGSKYRVCGSGL